MAKKKNGDSCKSNFSQVVKWSSDLKSAGKGSCVFPPTNLWVKERGGDRTLLVGLEESKFKCRKKGKNR